MYIISSNAHSAMLSWAQASRRIVSALLRQRLQGCQTRLIFQIQHDTCLRFSLGNTHPGSLVSIVITKPDSPCSSREDGSVQIQRKARHVHLSCKLVNARKTAEFHSNLAHQSTKAVFRSFQGGATVGTGASQHNSRSHRPPRSRMDQPSDVRRWCHVPARCLWCRSGTL